MKISIFALGLAAVLMAFVWICLLPDKPRTHVKCRQECGDRAVSVAQKDDGSENALPDYDPTNPSERAKADEKIVAFLREHTGHSFGDDFAAAGFNTNESTVTFPARKPFGIFDEVEVSQIAEEGRFVSEFHNGKEQIHWSRHFTGKIQSFHFKTSQKNVVTNVAKMADKADEMLKSIGKDLAKRVDLQEDYFDLRSCAGIMNSLKKQLDRQKSVGKPYPNIKMYLRGGGRRYVRRLRRTGDDHHVLDSGSQRMPSYASDLTLTLELSKKTKDIDLELRRFKSEDEVFSEWREEQRQLGEINKCYSHGVFLDNPSRLSVSWTDQYHAADIHLMTAFKQVTGFRIGQGYVSGVVVTTNASMECEIQEVDLPVKFCAAKKEHLLFKNGRLYGASIQVPFYDTSSKKEKRPARIIVANRDGVWNEMDALFGIGPGCSIGDEYCVSGRFARFCGWNVEVQPMPEKDPPFCGRKVVDLLKNDPQPPRSNTRED